MRTAAFRHRKMAGEISNPTGSRIGLIERVVNSVASTKKAGSRGQRRYSKEKLIKGQSREDRAEPD
jgi:hypothetical protein